MSGLKTSMKAALVVAIRNPSWVALDSRFINQRKKVITVIRTMTTREMSVGRCFTTREVARGQLPERLNRPANQSIFGKISRPHIKKAVKVTSVCRRRGDERVEQSSRSRAFLVNGDGQPDCSREQNPRGVHHYQPTQCDSAQDRGATIGVYREVDQRRRSGQDRPGEIRS